MYLYITIVIQLYCTTWLSPHPWVYTRKWINGK